MIYYIQIQLTITLLVMTIESSENESDIKTRNIRNNQKNSIETSAILEPTDGKTDKMDESNQSLSLHNENARTINGINCKPIQQVCYSDYDCCSKSCAGEFFFKSCTKCKASSEMCQNNDQCCSKKCIAQNFVYRCSCFDTGLHCDSSSECCSKYCNLNIRPKPKCAKVPILLDDYILQNGLMPDDTTLTGTQQRNEANIQCSVVDHDQLNKNQRSGVPSELYRWRAGFFIKFTTNFTKSELKIITSGLTILNDLLKTCMPIYVWPSETNPTEKYVIIRKNLPNTGCYANIGRQLITPQIINLEAPGCISERVVVHEVMHALGLFHEQSRPDRDNHVDIILTNLDDKKYENNFNKELSSLTFKTPYSTESIMHYESTAFGKIKADGTRLNTILKKDGGIIGRNMVMTTTDKQKLLAMYCNKQ